MNGNIVQIDMKGYPIPPEHWSSRLENRVIDYNTTRAILQDWKNFPTEWFGIPATSKIWDTVTAMRAGRLISQQTVCLCCVLLNRSISVEKVKTRAISRGIIAPAVVKQRSQTTSGLFVI